jgi:hypothetical protein
MTPDMREGHEGFSSLNAGGVSRLALKSRSGAEPGVARPLKQRCFGKNTVSSL